MPTSGLYRYRNPQGQEVLYGDPTINREALKGATFLGRQGESSAIDPLAGFESSTPKVRRYETGNEELFSGGAPKAFSTEDAQKIRDKTAAEMQARIGAVEDVYAGLVTSENLRGEDRLGRTRAIGARGGLSGSPRGEAQKKKTEDYNSELIKNLEAQKASEISDIYDRIDSRSDERIAAERSRVEGETKNYLDFLEKNRKQALTDIQTLGSAGYTLDDLDQKDVEDLLSDTGFGSKVLLEAYMNANRPKELQTQYQYKYDEGTGKVMAYGVDPKTGKLVTLEEEVGTPKPSANSKLEQFPDGRLAWVDEGEKSIEFIDGVNVSKDGGTAGATDADSPFVSQPAYKKLGLKQKGQADSLNNLVRTLSEFKTYLDESTDSTGINLFGKDSGVLQTKLNSIIFAAAQAEGTGALQQADREVIQQIIPNPTNFGGAWNALTKGGKEGELLKIQDQIGKYTANLKNFGLVPTDVKKKIKVTSPEGEVKEMDPEELDDEEKQVLIDEGYEIEE